MKPREPGWCYILAYECRLCRDRHHQDERNFVTHFQARGTDIFRLKLEFVVHETGCGAATAVDLPLPCTCGARRINENEAGTRAP